MSHVNLNYLKNNFKKKFSARDSMIFIITDYIVDNNEIVFSKFEVISDFRDLI